MQRARRIEARLGRRQVPLHTRRRLAVGLSAAAALVAGAAPTGRALPDALWSVAVAGGAAALASHSRRGPLLLSAAVAGAAAASTTSLLAAAVALVAALLSTRNLQRRAPFTRGLAGGAVAVALLGTAGDLPKALGVLAWLVVGVAIARSAWPHVLAHHRRTVRWALGGLVLAAALASAGAAYGVARASSAVAAGTRELEAGLVAARAGDVDGSGLRLDAARATLESARRDVQRFGVAARAVPVVAQHVAALDDILGATADAASLAALTARATDVEDLTVTDGRIAVDAIAALERPLGRLGDALDEVVVQADRHADDPLLPQLRDRIDELEDEAARAAAEARRGAHAAHVMPRVLGSDGPRRYLVLFTSPAEARGRFGFPGSYAEVVLDDGRLDLVDTGSVSTDLFGRRPDQSGFDLGDPDLTPYVPLAATRDFRSVTIPPSFPTVATLAATQWSATYGRAPVDGVLRIDPAALAGLMVFTGPVVVDDVPEPLTALNIEDFLVLGQYVQFPDEQAPRRELLDTVSEVTFQRLEDGDLPSPRVLADVFGPLVDQQHLQAFATAPEAEAFLREIGLSGEIPRTTRDSLLVAGVNSAANKIDSFLERSIRYEATVAGDELEGTLTIDLRNGAPPSGLPLYVIGNLLQPTAPFGTNRTTMLVYTAVPATDVLVDGVPVPFNQAFTDGRWLHLFTVDLPPGGQHQVVMPLAGELPGDGPYSLELIPSGGAEPDDAELVVDGDASVSWNGPIEQIEELRDAG